jgi:hypothetical protein
MMRVTSELEILARGMLFVSDTLLLGGSAIVQLRFPPLRPFRPVAVGEAHHALLANNWLDRLPGHLPKATS